MPQNAKITKLVAAPSELYGVGFGNTLMDVIPGVVLINQKNTFCKIIKIEVISSIYGYMVGLVRVIHSECVTGASLAQWHIVHALICTFRQFPLATCHLQQPQVSSQSQAHVGLVPLLVVVSVCISNSIHVYDFLLQPNSCSLTGLIRSNCWEIGGQRNPALFFKRGI